MVSLEGKSEESFICVTGSVTYLYINNRHKVLLGQLHIQHTTGTSKSPSEAVFILLEVLKPGIMDEENDDDDDEIIDELLMRIQIWDLSLDLMMTKSWRLM